MTWLYDVRYSVPMYCGVQMAGRFTYESQVWPAGSWLLMPQTVEGHRKVVTDVQFRELERTHGVEAIMLTHPTSVGGSPILGTQNLTRQKKYRHRKEIERRLATVQLRRP